MHSHIEKIIRPDGKVLEVLAEFPAGTGPFPLLILAPGLRYDMCRPVIAQVASHLLSLGFAVFRFNWAFYTADAARGQPSEDLAAELQDFSLVLSLAKNDKLIQQQRISVAGKSLGSIVAWRVFREEALLKNCVLLTPLCVADKSGGDESSMVEQNYPDAAQENRPILMLAGNADPYCELAILHQFAASTLTKFKIVALDGNHSLEMPSADTVTAASKFDRNMQLLAKHIEEFLFEQEDSKCS
ncbi:dienelactone hydrolase family protein [Undibacterium umbellatum]|uniref:KANL3/Tex30 alpha/beta hydrolase-like domain-containing protein n=1 Tax=Undibacterium umbellatum TaxID=2762300 RepID=A0ABR6Z2U8_9BURK|nr:alpha/beta family hydrolase [Undibacterium umbellatum]MBC3906027.1 hypothetical protein [Undibacterium umbellatum]